MRKNTGGLPTLKEAKKEEDRLLAQDKKRRYKKAGIIAAAVAVAACLGFVAYNFISTAGADESKILALVPDNADTVVITPSSADWWSDVTNMAPLTYSVNELDPYAAGLQIKHLGYSRADDRAERDVQTSDPLRSIYLESPTEDDSAKVEAWLKEAKGKESRAVFRDGTVVQITQNWVKELEVPEKNVKSRSDYSMNVSDSKGNMWINYDNQVDSLAGAENPEKPLVSSYFQKSFALKNGTVWTGDSSDGITWTGKYTSGGIDMNLYDPQTSRSELAGTQKEIVSGTTDGQTMKIVENRLYSLIINSGVKKTGDETNYGAVEVKSIDKPVHDEKLGAVIEPSQWNRAVLGTGALTEGISKMTFSMSKSEMTVVFTYGGYGMTPDMPDFQSSTEGATLVPTS